MGQDETNLIIDLSHASMGPEFSQLKQILLTIKVCLRETNRLIEKEIRFGLTRGRGWGEGELDEGSQKVQTCSYKINKY